MQCLNLSNKEVKAAVDELTQVLGDEDAAYYVISENNGYAIDKAPNGEPSELFSALLSHFNGDRGQAIKAKSKVFTESFKKWFGDWLNPDVSRSNVSKVVDRHGEPLFEKLFPVKVATRDKQSTVYKYHPAEQVAAMYLGTNNGVVTSSDLMNKLSEFVQPNSPEHRLMELFKQSNVPVQFKSLGFTDEDPYMYYDVISNNIVVNSDKFGIASMGYNTHSIMHEIVHAYTSRTLLRISKGEATEAEKKMYNNLVKLRDHCAKVLKQHAKETGQFEDDYYGLNDIDEFAAELLTNRDFFDIIRYQVEDVENSNIFKLVWNFVKHIAEQLNLYKPVSEKLYQDLFDLVTYNIENDVTEDDFIDTNADLLALHDQAVHNMQSTLEDLREQASFSSVAPNLVQKIYDSLSSRLKVYRHNDPVVEQQVKKSMEWQIQNISQNLVSEYDSICNFLREADGEIKSTKKLLDEASGANGRMLDDSVLNDINENIFGFYCDILDAIAGESGLGNPDFIDIYRENLGKDNNNNYKLDTLLNRVYAYQKILENGKKIVNSRIALNAEQILEQERTEIGATTIYNYNANDINTYGRDISTFTYIFGAGDKIKDECIKSIFRMVNKADEKTRHAVYAKQQKLKALLDKTNKYKQLQFFEVDNDGNPTGYFVRSRNYGQFEKDYKAAMDEICAGLGLDVNDLNLPENRDIRIEYNRQRNQWLSEHCERRFTAEYYEAFNHLSNETQQQRESIQVNIRNLQAKARDAYGIFRPERLTPEERSQLKRFQLQKKQLASIYDINGRTKEGIQKRVAEELTELNQKLSKGIKYASNREAFEREWQRIQNDNTLTEEQKNEWLALNTRQTYKEEFYEQLKKIAKKYYGPEYEQLADRRRALLAMFRDDTTGEIDAHNLPMSTKNILKAISRKMTLIRKQATRQKKIQTLPGDYIFEEIADIIPTKQWEEDKLKYANQTFDEYGRDLWIMENAYIIKVVDSDGKTTTQIRPKSWYTKMVPKDKRLIEITPNNNWMEVDEESPYYNKAYYQAQQDHPELKDEYWIPKKSGHDSSGKKFNYDSSDRYDRIQNDPNAKALYDELLATMAEANAQYTNLNKTHPYRAPQISGTYYRYVKSYFKSKKGFGKLKAPFKGFSEYIKDKLSIRNDDEGFNKVLTKPNGERLNLIPQNYIVRLNNPAAITADVVGSVILYYRAAMKWKHRKEIQPKLELLKSYVKGKKYKDRKGLVKQGETNTYKFIKQFIDMNLYDIKQQNVTFTMGGNKNGKLFGIIPYKGSIFNLINYDMGEPKEINVTKMLAILRTIGTARNLALNIRCALTGCWTALFGHIVNQMVGRYYNPIDAAYALRDMVLDMLLNVPNKFGVYTRVPFMSKCMEYFEVGAKMELNPTNRNTLLNTIGKHWGFGLYSLSDHLVKGMILGSIMNNYKLIVDDEGNRRFVSREEYKRMNNLDVFKPGDILDWNFGDKLSFRDAIQFVGGEMVAKDKENQAAVDAVKNEIAYLARQLSQSADGQLTDLQRSVIFANAFGQFAMMHRQYYPVTLQERYTMGQQLDYQTRRKREATFATPFRIIRQAINENTSIIQAFKNQYVEDPATRENLKKIPIELGMWCIVNYLLVWLLSSSAEDDKKNKLKQLLAFSMEATSFEILAPYMLKDMINLIKNPSAIISYVENMFSVAAVPADLAIDNIKAIFTDKKVNKKIKRGPYKGMTKNEKALLELTPVRNLIRLRDIQSQRNYYNKQIRRVDTKD